jgi:hypothetical protein
MKSALCQKIDGVPLESSKDSVHRCKPEDNSRKTTVAKAATCWNPCEYAVAVEQNICPSMVQGIFKPLIILAEAEKIPQNKTMKIQICLAVICVFVTSSCSSVKVAQTSGDSERLPSISRITTSVDANSMTSDQASWYRVCQGPQIVQSVITDKLRRNGKISSDGPSVEFEATDFKIRSGGAVFWVGVMAGSDYLNGRVTVRSGGRVLRTFEVKASGLESAWSGMALGRLSERSRIEVFAQQIADELMKQLFGSSGGSTSSPRTTRVPSTKTNTTSSQGGTIYLEGVQ